MSIFNEFIPKLRVISDNAARSVEDELQACFVELERFETEHLNERLSAKEKAQKDKTLMTTLQSINEDEDDSSKENDDRTKENKTTRRVSKRSKDENTSSPEQDKRQKRNASVKAQSIISKQVNVSLNQKLRRNESTDKKSRRKEDDKENSRPMLPIQIKQEKISLLPEPMDTACLPLVPVDVKQEPTRDEIAMPPPVAPVPKPRKALQKEKTMEQSDVREEESSRTRRTTRRFKLTDSGLAPVTTAATSRSLRASSRASSRAAQSIQPAEDLSTAETQPRPKRTRGRKKASETASETDNVTESAPSSPADKPRPKRTRRGKNAEKEPPKPEPTKEKEKEPEIISPKEERISQPEAQTSPVMKPIIDKKKQNKNNKNNKKNYREDIQTDEEERSEVTMDKTQVISAPTSNVTVTLNNQHMDETVVLSKGVYNHAPDTPKAICGNETVVLESNSRETLVLEKHINDATVVLDKDPKPTNISEDNSLLTDDNSGTEPHTPPATIPQPQPTSAVKEKVQQFEELAARTTRTKTRAMAKQEESDNTPPDKMIKPALSQETLAKMNNMIFNGKQQSLSSSAAKPRAIPTLVKSHSASASKAATLVRQKEAAEESLKKDREDARKKKEAMLEAKRELQKKKREEKMANAAAAREAAERERKLAMELLAKGRIEKQIHADQGKMERIKEQERKKQELARKVAETEERRKAEEQARQQRLADEHRKAEALRKKQAEESEAAKREAAQMAKEIEKRQKEYQEKQKLKHKMHTPLKSYYPVEPVYMADGFQYLTENEEDDVQRPIPAWSTSKARKQFLSFQSQASSALIDKLFSVGVFSPDLREIFPDVDRNRIKRTSSAVWRTPTKLPALLE